ncbi:MAG TPA: DUF885 domain-containing protein [Gemmatimonadales bacterium]|nr:DUF885 domain-containing protein [Gemmatimonadales bacterium]
MRAHLLVAMLGVAAPASTQAQSAVLSRLLTDAHERTISNSITLQNRYGRNIERLPSVSLASDEADATFARALLDTLQTLDRTKLTPSEQLSAATLDWILQGWVQAPKYYWLSFSSITPYQSPLTGELLFLGRDMPLDTPEHRERFLARLSEIGPLADSIRLGLEARATRGIRLNQAEVQQVIGALGALRKPGTSSPYSPSTTRIDISTDPALGARIAQTIDDKLNPALGRLIDYLGGEYLAKAPEAVGLKQYPGGEEYYRYLVGRSTTLDLTPEEIHQRGLDHLATLETSMDSLLKVIGFKGTRKEFLAAMNRDPRFRAKTPEEVGARYQKYYEAIKPLVPELFLRVPKAAGEFRRLNPALEGSQTYGFYQAPSPSSPVGIYFYNASHLETRSLFSVANIAYHELVPGHHFQISLAQENPDLPPLRRDFGAVAFNEGWAEYASGLAGELGLFSDPYDLYGRLISEAFLTTRLVVDPGMNLLGWSRERAMQFMRDHTMMAESEIASESLRYSVDMPAQALGYKVGAFEFWRLRGKAEQALGPTFDVGEFHALILDAGALPMQVVGEMVDRWIASK